MTETPAGEAGPADSAAASSPPDPEASPVQCPLCRQESGTEAEGAFLQLTGMNGFAYRLCRRCRLIFAHLPPRRSREEDRARYLLHRNSPEDEGYLRFLGHLWEAMRPLLRPGMRGLDYGCGPVPVLARLVRAAGFACEAYDPLFPEASSEEGGPDVPAKSYDFVLCSEVVEHFREVEEEWIRLAGRLPRGGLLGVMTGLWKDPADFRSWPYTSDPTHLCFYHARTLEWIAKHFGWTRVGGDDERVAVFRV
jgi:hypothetical protein